MSRGASTAFKTAAAAGNVTPALLAYFDFSGGEVRLWSGIGDLSWGGNTYTGAGDLVQVDPVQETNEVRANGLSFRLNGMPSAMVTRILGEHYRGRSCKLWLALFDASAAIIADPLLLFSGRMDQCLLDDTGESCSITVAAESRLLDLQRPRERRRTDEDQRGLFAGDLGFAYVSGLQDREVVWGGGNSGASGVNAPGMAGVPGSKPGTIYHGGVNPFEP
jgi:hypothetical protein